MIARLGLALCLLTALAGPASSDALDGDAAFARGDYETAYREWQGLAAAGDASAMLGIGTLYDTGHGVRQDFAAALAWYRRAAEAGSVSGAFNVAVMNDVGRGTPVDRRAAIGWYRLAAERGSGRAAYNLGVIYRDGDGAPRDAAAAIRYFRMAAAEGLSAAQGNLAALGAAPPKAAEAPPATSSDPAAPGKTTMAAFHGAALARSAPDAATTQAFARRIEGVREAAAQGNYAAQYDLGWAYQKGFGVKADLARAYVYYLRAATSAIGTMRKAALVGAREASDAMSERQRESAREMLLEDAS